MEIRANKGKGRPCITVAIRRGRVIAGGGVVHTCTTITNEAYPYAETEDG